MGIDSVWGVEEEEGLRKVTCKKVSKGVRYIQCVHLERVRKVESMLKHQSPKQPKT